MNALIMLSALAGLVLASPIVILGTVAVAALPHHGMLYALTGLVAIAWGFTGLMMWAVERQQAQDRERRWR